MTALSIRGLRAGYGPIAVLHGIDLEAAAGRLTVIVGPNGAGKSTTLKAVFGLIKVASGSISFAGEEITNSLPDRLVPKGLSFVPQEKNVFTTMSVEENLEMGAFTRKDDFSTTLDWV